MSSLARKSQRLSSDDICFRCQKAACCFQICSTKFGFSNAAQHEHICHIWFNFSYLFVIFPLSTWTRKWPFLWGPRLQSLAAIKLTKVNGNSRSFGILACGRKLRLVLRGDASICFDHLSLQPVSKSNPHPVSLYILYIVITSRYMYSCQVLLLDMQSEASHKELVTESVLKWL